MRVFISSLIRGLEPLREAAAGAVRALDHEVIQAERFGASSESPQRACLAAVRAADALVLILGANYGARQESGLSASHEEYREATERCHVLVFVQEGVQRDEDQERFLEEAQRWTKGHYTASFSTPEGLRDELLRALHKLELALASGPADETELLERATALVPSGRDRLAPVLCLTVAGGPRQQVLRPAELENLELRQALRREALLGDVPVLDWRRGTNERLEGDALVLEQEWGSVMVDELGSVRVVQPAQESRAPGSLEVPALVEEHVRERLERALRFVGWALDRIDQPRRVSDLAIVAALIDVGLLPWRTLAEHERNPRSGVTGMGHPHRIVVQLTPPSRRRATLALQFDRLAEDLTVLLRRGVGGGLTGS